MKKVMLFMLLLSNILLTTVMTAQTLKNNHITGVISNSLKRPVVSAWVILSQDKKQIGKSLTGDDGKYYIGNLEQGNYYLEVKKVDKYLFQKQVSLPKDTINNIQLP